jgi:hypothetical protein
MKVILGLMCGLVVLFGGSCVILAGSGMGGLSLLVLAVVLLNALVLIALFGVAAMPTWPLYFLAAVDFLIAAGCGYGIVTLPSIGSNDCSPSGLRAV